MDTTIVFYPWLTNFSVFAFLAFFDVVTPVFSLDDHDAGGGLLIRANVAGRQTEGGILENRGGYKVRTRHDGSHHMMRKILEEPEVKVYLVLGPYE